MELITEGHCSKKNKTYSFYKSVYMGELIIIESIDGIITKTKRIRDIYDTYVTKNTIVVVSRYKLSRDVNKFEAFTTDTERINVDNPKEVHDAIIKAIYFLPIKI